MATTEDPPVETGDETTESDLAAQDPEQYSQRQRLKAIFEARERVTEQRRRADDAVHYGEISERTANTVLRSAVEDYIYEVEWLIRFNEEDVERAYWDGIHLGKMLLPDGDERSFYGLSSIVNCPDPIPVSWQEQEQDQVRATYTEEYSGEMQIPRDILMTAYRACNQFLAEIDLDLDVQKEVTEAGFTYDDIVAANESDKTIADIFGWE